MRLLFLTDRYPPHITGGYEIACASIAEGLRGLGHQVKILTSDFGLTRPTTDARGVDRLLHYKQQATGLFQLARWDIADCGTLRRTITSWKPDLISAWSLLHLFPSLHHVLCASGVPVVYNLHDTWLPRHLAEAEHLRSLWVRPTGNWLKRFGKAVFRRMLQWSDPDWLRPLDISDLALANQVFCSRFQLTQYIDGGLPPGHAQVIYNGINTAQFTGDPRRAESNQLRVLFVGRLVPEKGAHTAVEAIEELHRRGHRGVRLSIAGVAAFPWDYAAGLRAKVESAELAPCCRWLGAVPNDSLPEVYRQHDVLVFPSSHLEGLPMTLLESMASGLVVVGTLSGGNIELLEDGVNCLTIRAADPGGLADALCRLLADSNLAHTIAAEGQRLIREKFTIEAAVAHTDRLYHELISRTASSNRRSTSAAVQ